MKPVRSYFNILIAILLTVISSCEDTGPVNYQNATISIVPQSLSIYPTELNFHSADAGSSYFRVESTNVDWQITDIPEWITVKPQKGGNGNTKVTVTISENTQAVNRVGILSFKATDESWSCIKTMTVSQARCKMYAIPEKNRVEFDGSAGSAQVKVSSNTADWKVAAGASMSWCTVSKSDGSINITVTPNTGNGSRSGQIEISTDDGTEYVTILQRPANISSTTEQLDFSVSGCTRWERLCLP